MLWIIVAFMAGGICGVLLKIWLDGIILEGMQRDAKNNMWGS